MKCPPFSVLCLEFVFVDQRTFCRTRDMTSGHCTHQSPTTLLRLRSHYTARDSFCAAMKFISDSAFVYTQERFWRRDFSDAAKLCRVDLSKVERHISDRCSYSIGQLQRRHKIHTDRVPVHTQKQLWQSVTQRSRAAATSKAESHISDSCTHYSGQLFVSPRTAVGIESTQPQGCKIVIFIKVHLILLFLCIETEIEKLHCDN